ncbi:MAG: hypothetical protein Kow0098_08040 [Ignavibacteriaceae bacterium]
MKRNIEETVNILSRTPGILKSMLTGLPEVIIKSNEGENTWSPFDVVGHLIHGERTDWIVRIRTILEKGESKTFDPFDRFAQFRESEGKTIDELLNDFSNLRKENLRVLKDLNLTSGQFKLKGRHPEFGVITLSELISTWVVHDLDHIAQISRVIARQYADEVGPWKAFLSILKES